MASGEAALYRDLEVTNELGLHARSAAKIAKIAQMADKGVWLHHGGFRADAKQVIDILTLGAGQGDRVRLCIESPVDIVALDRIAALFASGFGE